MSQQLDEIFSPIILLFTTNKIIWIIRASYSIVKHTMFSKQNDIVLAGFLLATNFIQLCGVVMFCILTEKEAKRTSVILYDHEASPKDVSQLTYFSLKLLHENVKFTAAGMFELNGSFIHSIIAVVCSYLVIILQFEVGTKTGVD